QIPPELEFLLSRMLAKDPQKRPADATALLAELVTLNELPDTELPAAVVARPSRDALADGEQLLYSVVVAIPRIPRERGVAPSEGHRNDGEKTTESTIRRVLSEFGAFGEMLADGSLVAAMNLKASATDQVAQAARCALAVQERWPDARVAMATGRGMQN